MGKKNFRACITDRAAAAYPSLLEDSGRRSFLRVLGGGLLAAAVGRTVMACDDTSSLAGYPDMLHSPRDAAVEQPADGWFHDLSGMPDMPPTLKDSIYGPDGLPPADVSYEQANVDTGVTHVEGGAQESGTKDSSSKDSSSKDSGAKDSKAKDGATIDSASADVGERSDLVVIKP